MPALLNASWSSCSLWDAGELAIAQRCGAPSKGATRSVPVANLVAEPVASVVRSAGFYALMQLGVTGRSPADESNGWGALAGSYLFGNPKKKRPSDLKFRTKWHPTTKGTLIRHYRVPTLSQGRKLLLSVSSLLSSDDAFTDASTHKGCQVRRENAHAESVCCHNVRALLDEFPTPHLVVEITVFPAGPITEVHYDKAEKLEKVLRTGTSI